MNHRKYYEHITQIRYLQAVCEDCGEHEDSSVHNKEAFAIKLENEGWTIHCYRLLCPKCKRSNASSANGPKCIMSDCELFAADGGKNFQRYCTEHKP